MKQLTRRKVLAMGAITPVAALVRSPAVAAVSDFAPETQASARARIQQQHLPNVRLVTHDGEEVQFYEDLVKDKVVTLNFFYAECDDVCPAVMSNLAEVQTILGDKMGRQVFMYSITLKPEEDTVNVLKYHRKVFGAGPGWTFLTGKTEDVEKLRKGIGFTNPEPALDRDKTQHIGNVRYGNEPLMLWAACAGMAPPSFIAGAVCRVIPASPT
jgi:protein SCO1/2